MYRPICPLLFIPPCCMYCGNVQQAFDDPPIGGVPQIGGVPLPTAIVGSLIQPGMGAMYNLYYKKPGPYYRGYSQFPYQVIWFMSLVYKSADTKVLMSF